MKRFLLLMAIAFISTAAVGQKADVAFVAGGSFVSDTSGTLTVPEFPFFNPRFTTDTHLFLEGAFSARLLNAHAVALYVETPVAFIPSTQLSVQPSTGLFGAPIPIDHIRSLFVTPGLKVNLLPGASISPWGQCGWRLGTLFAGGFRSGREQSSTCIRRWNRFQDRYTSAGHSC